MKTRPTSDEIPYVAMDLATTLFARQYGFSGPEIHRFFSPYTEVLGSYPMPDKPSRWMIFDRAMKSLPPNDQREILMVLLEMEWSNLDPDDLDKLRQYLVVGTKHTSEQIRERLDSTSWTEVDRSWTGALRLVNSNPRGAITAARTTLESVCKHICDDLGVEYPTDGDLSRLYKASVRGLRLAPDHNTEQVIRQVLSGVSTVVDGLGAMRNKLGDAHGKGPTDADPSPRHARLAVNMALGVATFLLDTFLENKPSVSP